jgi:hypothetical protein
MSAHDMRDVEPAVEGTGLPCHLCGSDLPRVWDDTEPRRCTNCGQIQQPGAKPLWLSKIEGDAAVVYDVDMRVRGAFPDHNDASLFIYLVRETAQLPRCALCTKPIFGWQNTDHGCHEGCYADMALDQERQARDMEGLS